MEGIINPLAVRDPWRCASCGYEWLDYDVEDEADSSVERRHTCPRCSSEAVARIGG